MGSPKTKGRMINKDISDSKSFSKLSSEAAVLFCMMIPHLNSHGKMNGDPGYIKAEVCPRIPYLDYKNIYKYLQQIHDYTNMKWFEHDGRHWIHAIKFLSDHQAIRPEKLGEDLLPTYSGLSTELVQSEVEVEVEEEYIEGKSGLSTGLKKKKPKKHKHGEYQNVLLTDDEVVKLKEKLNSRFNYWIRELDEGIERKGYKYDSHYATILNWVRKHEEKTGEKILHKPKNYTQDKIDVALKERDNAG